MDAVNDRLHWFVTFWMFLVLNFLFFFFYLKVHECTAHQNGSASTDTMGVQLLCGPSASCYTTWCVAISPLNTMKKFLRARSSTAAGYQEVSQSFKH